MLNNIAGVLAPTFSVTNSYESISTVDVGSGGSSSITFSSIPSTFKHLQIRAIGKDNRDPANNNSPALLTVNGDTGANYSYHELTGNGSSAAAYGAANTSNISAYLNSNSTNIFGVFIVDILDYANTNKYKTIRTLGGTDRNGSGQVAMTSGTWRNTNAITSVTFTPFSSPFAQYSSFALYGIKG